MRRFPLFLVLLVLPATSVAEDPVYGNPYEATCRAELGLGTGEIRPGPSKGMLRRCLRLKASDARRGNLNIRTNRTSTTDQQKAIQQQIEEQEQERYEEVLVPGKTTGQMLEQLCRDELGLGNQVLRPGPVKGQVIRCVRLKTATQKKEADVRRKRQTVQRRQEALHKKILQKETSKQNADFNRRSDLKRKRLRAQPAIDSEAFKNIRDSSRSRTDFSRKRGERSRTVQRNNAAKCRGVSSSEWASCIREALGGGQE